LKIKRSSLGMDGTNGSQSRKQKAEMKRKRKRNVGF
jgi:hypothetical protein